MQSSWWVHPMACTHQLVVHLWCHWHLWNTWCGSFNWWRVRRGYGCQYPHASGRYFEQDSRAPIAYLAFEKRGLCSTWLHCRLDQVAMSQLSWIFQYFLQPCSHITSLDYMLCYTLLVPLWLCLPVSLNHEYISLLCFLLQVKSQCTALLNQKSGFRGDLDSGFSSCTAPTYYCGSKYFYNQHQIWFQTECSLNRDECRVIIKLELFPIVWKSEFRSSEWCQKWPEIK